MLLNRKSLLEALRSYRAIERNTGPATDWPADWDSYNQGNARLNELKQLIEGRIEGLARSVFPSNLQHDGGRSPDGFTIWSEEFKPNVIRFTGRMWTIYQHELACEVLLGVDDSIKKLEWFTIGYGNAELDPRLPFDEGSFEWDVLLKG